MNDLLNQIVCVYKTNKRADTYLYTLKNKDLSTLPEGLKEIFGTPLLTLSLLLKKDKTFARFTREQLVEALNKEGFYLQLPDKKDDYMLDLYKDTSEKYENMGGSDIGT
ncbi:YcgL domain-containing protein [Marinicellulosiphila megalodicopiae]|uniref:YcgL domain-containing protein n=1 Tax=Marinicellulosiphila megalodicopiae TaxID=2724896 RepID=UPI003BB05FD4